MATKVRLSGPVMLVAALFLVGVVTPLQAGAPANVGYSSGQFTFNFDENGNGSISVNGAPFIPLIGVLAPDPSGGITSQNVLIYTLPELVIEGDVSVFDGSLTGPLGDVFRFTDPSGSLSGIGNLMIFYSDTFFGDPADSLADTPSPPFNLNTGNTASAVETGTEGANGFQYSADPNQYNGISDTPEPATLTMLGMGLMGLAFRFRRKKNGTHGKV